MRISVLIPLIIILSALISSGLLYVDEMNNASRVIKEQGIRNLNITMSHLQNMLHTQLGNGDIEDAKLSLSTTALLPGIDVLFLIDDRNQIHLANHYDWEGRSGHIFEPFKPIYASQVGINQRSKLIVDDESSTIYGYYPIASHFSADASEEVRVLFVVYDFSTLLAEAQQGAIDEAIYFAGIMISLSAIVAWLLHQLVSKQVLALASASREFAKGNCDVGIRCRGYGELAELANAFNQMLTSRKEAFSALSAEQERIQYMLQSSPVAVCIVTNNGHHLVFANQCYCELINITQDELDSVDPRLFYRDHQDCDEIISYLSSGRNILNRLLPMEIPDLGEKWVMASFLHTEFQGEGAILVWLYDITERKQLEDQMLLANTVFYQTREAILVTDHNNNIISVNRAFTNVTGYRFDEVVGKNPSILSSGRHDKHFYQKMYHDLEKFGYWQGQIWDRRKNGEIYPKWLSISVTRDENNNFKNHIAIFNDITERIEAQEKIEYLAQHDPLTGLPNRVLLQDRFNHAAIAAERYHSRMAMLFLDLDNFKQINDNLGHEIGDQLLKQIADRLKSSVRANDTICRQGGDEFIILLQDVKEQYTIASVAQKILDKVAEPYHFLDHDVSTSFSIGISLFPSDGTEFSVLQNKADTAMYHAKESGRNTYRFYTEKMDLDTLARFQMMNHLREAVRNNDFYLHYQPQIDILSGEVVGVEALIRWCHVEQGCVSPGHFIPAAEESGLIIPIGRWVMEEACRQAKRWHDSGLPKFSVAVNLSSLQFKRGNIFEMVYQVLMETGLDPQYLELELTESILLEDTDEVVQTIQKLKHLGVILSIDDFGTGYSSMAYLKKLKLDKLKIDQSFVRDIHEDMEDSAIVKAIIQLGKSLQLEVIAEGVESAEQLAFLKAHGCHQAQGYFIAHPVSSEEIEAFIRSRNIPLRPVSSLLS